MFFIHIFFSTSSLTLPWTMAGFLHPFYNFGLAHCRVIRETFIFNHSVIFLLQALRALSGHFLPRGVFYLTLLQRHFKLYLSRFLVGIFYPEAFFTLRSFKDILNCIYQGFSGSRQDLLEVCRALSCSQILGQGHLLV